TGRAFAPSPKRSTSPQATSTLEWLDSLKALDPNRPIREADILFALINVRFWGQSGHDSVWLECPLVTQSGHRNWTAQIFLTQCEPRHARFCFAGLCRIGRAPG